MQTALLKINTDEIRNINFLKFQTVMLKEWNKDRTQCRHSKLNMLLFVYPMKFNFTKKTLQTGNKVFEIKENTGFTYSFTKKAVKCSNINNLYKHFKDASKQDNVFHTSTGSLLRNICNK